MTIDSKPSIDLKFKFEVNEKEARALDALVGYDFDNFVKVFKSGLGAHYIDGHEESLRGIFSQLRNSIPQALLRLELAQKEFAK